MSSAAFLVPFLGPLPPFFAFWARSCEINQARFHWYVYHDGVAADCRINAAVTLVPYSYQTMMRDFARILDIRIPPNAVRKICDFRILFYFLRRMHEPLDSFDFIGYTDMDMLYGRLDRHLPHPMADYAVIAADDGAPCGPFTLMQRQRLELLAQSAELKTCLEDFRHHSFNESPRLLALLAAGQTVHCRAGSLQPALGGLVGHRKTIACWQPDELTVWDSWGRRRTGGFYHFSRYKSHARFVVDSSALQHGRWGVSKYGIRGISSERDLWKMRVKALI